MTTITKHDKSVRVLDGAYHSEGWDFEPYWLVRDDMGKIIGDLPCHYGRDELRIIAGAEAVAAFFAPLDATLSQLRTEHEEGRVGDTPIERVA